MPSCEYSFLAYNETMSWPERIRRLRGELSQEEFAALGQTSTAMIRALEAGTRQASIVTLENLIKGRGLTLAEFVGSAVLERFSDPLHQELHEKLQFVLDADSRRTEGIKVNIEDIYDCTLRDLRAPVGTTGEGQKTPPGARPGDRIRSRRKETIP